ncbi:hypothetical protein [Pseudobacteroides cellulosolvens]|uniref:hypothetical protein n=1 Tax=Pseudobacteroides cellulosolvens TaxID=35825 RepID=UPI0012B51B75|nr:hypothetical protein [Pseudobacteroides cellulosolvens]
MKLKLLEGYNCTERDIRELRTFSKKIAFKGGIILYKRLAVRRGRNRATVAVGHSILTIAYYILGDSKSFYDLGSDYFEQKKKQDIARRALKRLEDLGYKVTVEKMGA